MVGILDTVLRARQNPMSSSLLGSIEPITLGNIPSSAGFLSPDAGMGRMTPRGLTALGGGAAQASASRPQGLLGSIRSGLGGLSEEMALGLAGSLLGGPTRTPVGFGTKIMRGLQAGREAERQRQTDLLTNLLTGAKIQEALKPETDLANVVEKSSGRVVGQVRVGSEEYNKAFEDPRLFLDPKGSGLAGGIDYRTLLGLKESGVQDINTEYQTKLAATENLVMAGNKILETLDTEPDATTKVAELLGGIENVKANAVAAARVLGIDPEKSYTEDGVRFGFKEEHFEDIFSKFAIKSAVTKSRILDLAYLAAERRGQEGRGLSDRDIKIFSDIIGGSGSPKARYEKLKAYLEGSVEDFNLYRDRQIKRYGDALKNPIPISSKVNIYQPQSTAVDTGLTPEGQEAFIKYGQPNGNN